MNTLIIFQKDAQISQRLSGHGLSMAGEITQMQGFQAMASGMTVAKSPKGLGIGDVQEIYKDIVRFCQATLAVVQDDVVQIQIIFVFHQTNGGVARNIINACRSVEWTHILDDLANAANKQLRVANVVMLSCESAADIVLRPPIWKGLQGAVDQARDMRNAAKAAFKTKMAPPYPSQGTYFPTIITYSTGNVDRGGVVLDPFHVKFVDLDGRFDENGKWHWDNPGDHDPDGDPAGGTIYADNEATGLTSETKAAEEEGNLMGFHP